MNGRAEETQAAGANPQIENDAAIRAILTDDFVFGEDPHGGLGLEHS
jgi:hypothetical protein